MPRTVLIKLRRDTAANWTSANPTLAAGEPGYETDTGKLKIGDGATAWTGLAYFSTGGASSPLTTKGDLYGYSSADARIPVGSDGQVLVADSAQTLGVKWAAGGSNATGYEFDYAELNSGSVNISTTTDATATTVITGASVTYDGSTIVLIDVFFPAIDTVNAAGDNMVIVLYDGATDLGRLGLTRNVAASVLRMPFRAAYRLTPSAAAHQYIVKAFVIGGGTGVVYGGAAGAAVNMPGFLRVTRVN
jgi:hypothetical protein